LDNASAGPVFRSQRTEPQGLSSSPVLSECDGIARRTLQGATETISQESDVDRPNSERLFARP